MNMVWRWPTRHSPLTNLRRALSKDTRMRADSTPPRIRPQPVAPVRHRTCQWIEGEPRPSPRFCGAPVEPGHSWCRCHLARVFQPRDEEKS